MGKSKIRVFKTMKEYLAYARSKRRGEELTDIVKDPAESGAKPKGGKNEKKET